MSKIYLIRHGQSLANEMGIFCGRLDMELTDLGRAQAAEVADKLFSEDIEVIYSSPLKRAYETAQIIGEKLGINEIITDDRLAERDFGVATGKPVADAAKYAKGIVRVERSGYFLEAEGAENFPALLRRGKEVLKDIRRKHSDKNVAVVTHGDIGKMIQTAYYGWDWEDGLKTPFFGNAEIIELA